VIAVLLMNVINLVYGLIDRHLGSYLAEGSIAALQYANSVANQPLTICATALGTAIFPYLSDRIGADDHAGASSLFDRAMRWALLGAVPAAVAVAILGSPIITVLFERGEFDAAARTVTGALLAIYGLWIVPAVLVTVIGKIFYAGFRWKPILIALVAALVFKAGLSFWLVDILDVAGLVVATTVATIVSALMMFALLPTWSTRGHWLGWLRLTIATAALFAVPCYLASFLPSLFTTLSWHVVALLSLLVGIGGGSCGLLLLGPRLGVEEISGVRASIKALLLHGR